jgi:hypothetical protein
MKLYSRFASAETFCPWKSEVALIPSQFSTVSNPEMEGHQVIKQFESNRMNVESLG